HCAAYAREVAYVRLDTAAHRLELSRPLGRHGDREHHLAVADDDIGDQTQADDIAPAAGHGDAPEFLKDIFFGDLRHKFAPARMSERAGTVAAEGRGSILRRVDGDAENGRDRASLAAGIPVPPGAIAS